jgi:hypothetical protein
MAFNKKLSFILAIDRLLKLFEFFLNSDLQRKKINVNLHSISEQRYKWKIVR